nr:MAG TPA: hypothetical protein [Caudoviricetes sp.]
MCVFFRPYYWKDSNGRAIIPFNKSAQKLSK